MYVIEQNAPRSTALPGIAHATWAGAAEGLSELSLWRQSMAAGSATPPHSHDCDEIVLCLSGSGELHIDGQVHGFAGPSTLVLPRGVMHQIVNTGIGPMETLGIFGGTPVVTRLPDRQAIDLPWRT